MNAILSMFCHGGPAFIGPKTECHRLAQLVNKWDSISTEIEDLFDDGLTYGSHCMSLYIENDRRAWQEMEELFAKTKAQGKTSKSNQKKAIYFRKGMDKILNRHCHRLLVEAGENVNCNVTDPERFTFDSGTLITSWLNYYFQEFDRDMGWKPIPLYTVDSEKTSVIDGAKSLEKRCRGRREPVKFTEVNCSEVELEVAARSGVSIRFEWDDSEDAIRVMGLMEKSGWTARDGTHFDHTKPIRKRLHRLFPKCSFDVMDVPYNLYGEANNWFNITFNWKPEHFSWREVQRAAKFVKENVEPMFKGKFRPKDQPKKYHVVTLIA